MAATGMVLLKHTTVVERVAFYRQWVMGISVGFVIKVLGLSTALALLIKLGAPSLNVSPSTTVALIAVLAPTVVMAGVLALQLKASQ